MRTNNTFHLSRSLVRAVRPTTCQDGGPEVVCARCRRVEQIDSSLLCQVNCGVLSRRGMLCSVHSVWGTCRGDAAAQLLLLSNIRV